MVNRNVLLCLLIGLLISPVANAQLFQPFRGRPLRPAAQPRFQSAPHPQGYQQAGASGQLSVSGRPIVTVQQQEVTPQQRREFRLRQKARQELARRRQREMEQQGQSKSIYPRLSGEFETQQAILLSICDWQPQHFPVLKEIVEETAGHARLVILFNDSQALAEALQMFIGETYSHVEFLRLDLNTVWLRDFGPRIAEKENGQAMAIDFYYEGSRPKDDDFPEQWATLTGAEFNHVPWTLQGGNLLSNGKGLSIASSRIFDDNKVQFSASQGRDPVAEQQNFVIRQFKLFCNIKELVLLHPLEMESTKHVDMFSTFLAPDLALVAQVDRRYDPRNAQILDSNARKLSQVMVGGKPMRVERILVPPRQEKYWSPYTNIVLTDRLVLMPTFESDPPSYVQRAVETYRRLLPEHHVATIDMSSMSRLEGSLHCLTCNVPEFASMPKGLISFQEALRKSSQGTVSGPRNPLAKREPVQASPRQPVVQKSAKQTEYQDRIRKAREATKTYRREFRSASGEHIIDAYVVAVDERSATLMLADNKEEQIVRLSYFRKSDRDWLNTNFEKIGSNGPRVKEFLLKFVEKP